jgi:hypothetical protein
VTRYRLLSASRALALEDADQLVRFAFEATPKIERLVAVKVADGAGASGYAASGTARPRWAGRASFALLANRPPSEWHRLGRPDVCWHSTELVTRFRGWYAENKKLNPHLTRDELAALSHYRVSEWVAAQFAAGATRIGRWPIFICQTAEEALLHTLAHEAWHVLALDRERTAGRGSEIQAEEHALRVLTAYQEEHRYAEVTLSA